MQKVGGGGLVLANVCIFLMLKLRGGFNVWLRRAWGWSGLVCSYCYYLTFNSVVNYTNLLYINK